MDTDVLHQHLDEAFDQALVYHGFTEYMRDYEAVIYMPAGPGSPAPPTYLQYLFRYCVEARCSTTVPPSLWRVSLDDRLIDYKTGVDLDGYVWGVRWQDMYPGAEVITESRLAREWAESVGIDFHEVRFRTNAHDFTLVFSDLQVSELSVGYAPFVLREDSEP